ncbi:DNA-directed RNA polymerase II subunit L [Puccinia graminis f. sp. tritici]|uniref:DNA-directed RNA polymerases I, II, and III subunit RPABC5 n=1 Tax=Puccinia graminis f. sp. tritici TaxID=56615 RepID=A0A5B0P058_PUCGR|nr:DNA-directed RNA polymerase II subunit L [Puccinia graminis f. sp. tritici]KAA1094292.1 DNA-directed RNA polymerase II subunit L [Puccinia graminis f. sp. tritici]
MDAVGLKRYCCRRMVLTHVDLIEKLLQYNQTGGADLNVFFSNLEVDQNLVFNDQEYLETAIIRSRGQHRVFSFSPPPHSGQASSTPTQIKITLPTKSRFLF